MIIESVPYDEKPKYTLEEIIFCMRISARMLHFAMDEQAKLLSEATDDLEKRLATGGQDAV